MTRYIHMRMYEDDDEGELFTLVANADEIIKRLSPYNTLIGLIKDEIEITVTYYHPDAVVEGYPEEDEFGQGWFLSEEEPDDEEGFKSSGSRLHIDHFGGFWFTTYNGDGSTRFRTVDARLSDVIETLKTLPSGGDE